MCGMLQDMDDPRARVTLKMIAKAAGVTHPTASRALRNDSQNVSAATRKRVQDIAASLGYRPDPAMSALIAHRSRIRPHSGYEKLAILNTWKGPRESLPEYFLEEIRGMETRASELGYQTELFYIPDDMAGQKQLSRILTARGIQGVIVGPLPPGRSALALEWEKFYVAGIGYSLFSPQVHFVASNHLQTVAMIYDQLRQLGYEKIGFLHDNNAEKRNRHLYVASYLRSLMLEGLSQDASPPLLAGSPGSMHTADWMERFKFDAVICGGSYEARMLTDMLAATGRSIPEDLGLAVFARSHSNDMTLAGVSEDWYGIGTGAISLLHSLMLSRMRGIPEHRNSTLIDGVWQDGTSVRSRKPQLPEAITAATKSRGNSKTLRSAAG